MIDFKCFKMIKVQRYPRLPARSNSDSLSRRVLHCHLLQATPVVFGAHMCAILQCLELLRVLVGREFCIHRGKPTLTPMLKLVLRRSGDGLTQVVDLGNDVPADGRCASGGVSPSSVSSHCISSVPLLSPSKVGSVLETPAPLRTTRASSARLCGATLQNMAVPVRVSTVPRPGARVRRATHFWQSCGPALDLAEWY